MQLAAFFTVSPPTSPGLSWAESTATCTVTKELMRAAGHGAGEGIRGNINGFLDNVGEQIAGRGGQSDVGRANEPRTGEDNAKVAASGADEMKAGVDKLKEQ